MTSDGDVSVACVGAGYWGRNLIRVFHGGLRGARLAVVCDLRAEVLENVAANYSDVSVAADLNAVLTDDEVEAVVLAIPASSHFQAARRALEAGKHVFVEKPMTMDVGEAEELVALSDSNGLVLMVGHLLVYHPAVSKLRELVRAGEFGEIYYLYAQRVNLGVVRSNENALWNFGPHDVSVILNLLDMEPVCVSAQGQGYLQEGIEDVVFVNMHFADGKMAQLHLSWLDPHKARKLTIVGSRKMAVFDDTESNEKLRVYDKSAEREDYESYGEVISLRFGDITIPHLSTAEPLRLECQHFVDCVRDGQRSCSDGRAGLRVVRVLEAAQRSLDQRGVPISI